MATYIYFPQEVADPFWDLQAEYIAPDSVRLLRDINALNRDQRGHQADAEVYFRIFQYLGEEATTKFIPDMLSLIDMIKTKSWKIAFLPVARYVVNLTNYNTCETNLMFSELRIYELEQELDMLRSEYCWHYGHVMSRLTHICHFCGYSPPHLSVRMDDDI
jgi:hypothetical protein